jgi:Nuclease-related domain
VKGLALRRPDTCSSCATNLNVGTWAYWESSSRTVTCSACAEGTTASAAASLPPAAAAPPVPAAGASAQREFDRRVQRREAQVRAAHPKLGGLLLALFDEPASTRVWAQGARGERAVAAKLDDLASEYVIALHDRVMLRPDGRRSRANIDHIAIAASGVCRNGTCCLRRIHTSALMPTCDAIG